MLTLHQQHIVSAITGTFSHRELSEQSSERDGQSGTAHSAHRQAVLTIRVAPVV